LGALLRPVHAAKLFAAIVGMARAMVNHTLAAMVLYRTALTIPLGHARTSSSARTFAGPQSTKLFPAAGATITPCLGASWRSTVHDPL
jgi:hypothetical protein